MDIVPAILGALVIFLLRICDVSLGTLRTMFTVQGKKWLAAGFGLVESAIWVIAIRQVFSQLDNPINIIGYAGGFATGTLVGIVAEQKLALGTLHAYVISRHSADPIADALRHARFGVTLIPGEGGSGGMPILTSVLPRRRFKEFKDIVDSIDHEAFISVQNTVSSRGFMHGSRK